MEYSSLEEPNFVHKDYIFSLCEDESVYWKWPMRNINHVDFQSIAFSEALEVEAFERPNYKYIKRIGLN